MEQYAHKANVLDWIGDEWLVCTAIMCNYLDIYLCSTMHLRKLLCVIHHMCVYVCMLVLCMVPLHHLDMCRLWWLLMFFRGFDDDP